MSACALADAPPIIRSQGTNPLAEPDRLMSKAETLAILGVTYPTLWKMVRDRKFPAGRYIGTKVMWRSSEVEGYIESLPRQAAKGDAGGYSDAAVAGRSTPRSPGRRGKSAAAAT